VNNKQICSLGRHGTALSLDPLYKVCVDLHELMFQHFNKSDVLKASEFSSEWNEAISTSSKCMAQITLSFDWPKVIPAEIIKSQRQYSNLEIELASAHTEENNNQKIRLMVKLSPFLKNLKLDNNAEDLLQRNPWRNLQLPILQMPKLESLEINSHYEIGLTIRATKLKKLSLSPGCFDREAVDLIESQEKLEELKLHRVDECFLRHNPKAPKGIKQFDWETHVGNTNATKLKNFMEPMCDTLTFLKLNSIIRPVNIELIVNKMTQLKTLEIDESVLEDLNKAKLKSNTNIFKLIIDSICPGTQYLLLSLVNLEDLSVNGFTTNVADFEWIARNLMKLKKLSYDSIYESRYERIFQRYNEMKENEEGINIDIEIVINESEDSSLM
jgi:hypothetical protein